jgi:TetR/AcrR family transcriptional regulator, transcriptional repressor for nem operon
MAVSQQHRPVGRPREFDEEAVLEAAMDAFWRNGYEATSMADLCSCTGLHKGSLYQSFGDKHQLFMRALEHYAEQTFQEVAAVAFQSASPLANIRSVLHKICDEACHENGCLMINSIVELAPHDAEVRTFLQKVGEKRMRVMASLIEKAQQAGEMRTRQAPDKLARQLMVTLAGAAAMSKGFLGPEQATQVVNDLLDSWT